MSEMAIALDCLSAGYGGEDVIHDLSLQVGSGELIAVLGPNGSGKSTLLKVLLGLLKPTSGSALLWGDEPRVANRHVGYIPQHRDFDADLPIRGRELVELGISGMHYGIPWSKKTTRVQVDRAIEQVGARGYADAPVGMLSGGEQQRLRIAQALIGNPNILLCDEPLLALDLKRQQEITGVINHFRTDHDTAVLFVTHEINPILPYVDRVLYLVNGRAAIGEPHEVLTTERLTDLYGIPVDVHDHNGRIMVIAGEEGTSGLTGHHHDHQHEERPWA